jgi:probable H4MPT-linked C1 transfer pathway protein
MGWDIGGAHLKAAIVNTQGEVLSVQQQPCALWKGLAELITAVENVLSKAHVEADFHVLTMTGELVDLFINREHGVKQILLTLRNCLPEKKLLVYAGNQGFIKYEQINSQYYPYIASANWLASASHVAHSIESALFVDIGSTTTDILLLEDNQVQTENFTDFQRLCSEELVYTGIVRTPVMAVADETVFQGQRVGLMAEYFASMADVYRVTGELQAHHDQTETADDGDKSIAASCQRLARMLGCDFQAEQMVAWQQLAENLREQQLLKIQRACERQISRQMMRQPVMVGAGIGRFLVKKLASRLGLPYIDFIELLGLQIYHEEVDAADCAPAVAVALLYLDQTKLESR